MSTRPDELANEGTVPATDDEPVGIAGAGGSTRAPSVRGVINSKLFGYALSTVVILAVWAAVAVIFRVPEYILPLPHDVLRAMVDDADLFWPATVVTLRETLVGFGIAVGVGVPVGAAISFSKAVERLMYPMLVSAQAVPKVALAPLFVIWFGYGGTTIALVAASIAIFPIIVNTALGLGLIEADMVRLGRIMGGSKWRLFRKIRLPIALPSIFAGMKLGITLALIGAVVGEFVASSSGLGYIAQASSGNLQTERTFGALVALSAMGIVLFLLIEGLEKLFVGWHPSQQTVDTGM